MSRAPRPQKFPGVLALALALGMAATLAPHTAFAQAKGGPAPGGSLAPESPTPTEPQTKEQLEAQQHFQRAKDLYQAGSYREAIAELEAARLLDPKAKDLFFNLGIVHEKLGKFDEAIAFFHKYEELESVTPAERVKAENIIKRIEGAKREVPATPAVTPGTPGEASPPPPRKDTRRGRIDGATVAAGAVAVVGLGVGATFGILALSNKPAANSFVTGRDGTYDALQTKANDAHTQALVADVGFGVGIVAAAVTAYLYFSRTKDPKPTPVVGHTSGLGVSALAPSAVPIFSSSSSGLSAGHATGGAFVLGGAFR
jgi:tetratricopeptide (TPR) repeat protein